MEFNEAGEHAGTELLMKTVLAIVKATKIKGDNRINIKKTNDWRFTLNLKTVNGPLVVKKYKTIKSIANDIPLNPDQLYRLYKGIGSYKNVIEIKLYEGEIPIYDE